MERVVEAKKEKLRRQWREAAARRRALKPDAVKAANVKAERVRAERLGVDQEKAALRRAQQREATRKYREANREKCRAAVKKHKDANASEIYEKGKAKVKEWRAKHSDKMRAYLKDYWANPENAERRRERCRERYSTDTAFRLGQLLRSRLHHSIRGKSRTGSAVRDLGCTIDELKAHLEKQFLPGMTWENWALDGWHIDHILPVSSFDLSDREQFLKCVHFTNLRPMWGIDNIKKGGASRMVGADAVAEKHAVE